MEIINRTLFHYAPHELSHSAFWAWVISCYDRKDNAYRLPMELARSFMNIIEISQSKCIVDVKTEIPWKDAQNKGDFRVRFDIVVFFHDLSCMLIENKVSAGLDSSQLQLYSQIPIIEGHKIVKRVFLYAGYDFGFSDALKENKGWVDIGHEQIKELIVPGIRKHSVIKEYSDWIFSLDEEWNQIRSKLSSGDLVNINSALRSPEGQWELVKDIFKSPQERFDGCIYNGKNLGGSPWTQICFYELLRPKEGYDLTLKFVDNLFYRVDYSIKHGAFYLSLRQYLHRDYISEKHRDDTVVWNQKEKRLERLREIFVEVYKELQIDEQLIVGRPSNRGKFESEIGVFLINRNSALSELKTSFPPFHRSFLSKLRNDGWPLDESLWRET